MANRITIYGVPNTPDVKRLTRELDVNYVECVVKDPKHDARAARHLAEWDVDMSRLPIVEVLRDDDTGSLFLVNPDEPTLRQSLFSEGVISVTSYWI